MGTKMGPSYANLFVGFIEQQFFDKFDGTKPEFYRRDIDDCFGATSCSRQELDYFIASVNSFHPASKYTWVLSERSIPFLDINVSISGNRLSTSVHYKPTDSHSYLLHSHPAHVKNSIPYSQFRRLRRLCSDDTDFSEKAEEMYQFFKTRGYPDPVIHNSKHSAQSVHPQSAPLSSHNKLEGRIPLTLTFHPHNISVKNIILKNCELLPSLIISRAFPPISSIVLPVPYAKKYTSAKRAADWVIISANTLGMLRLTIKTLLNQSRDISTSLTILKNTWRFVAFLHLGNTESRKNIEQKFIFQTGTLSPCGINERFLFL